MSVGAFTPEVMQGYSPWPTARQETPFLGAPGAQGLQEGVYGGQGFAVTPQAQIFSDGTQGTAPPSSVPPQDGNMWSQFGGSGGAPSSFASAPGDLLGTNNVTNLISALRGAT